MLVTTETAPKVVKTMSMSIRYFQRPHY